MRWLRALAPALVSIVLPLAAAAQTSTIRGVVSDAASGMPLPAMIAAAYDANGNVFRQETASTGQYSLDVPQGTYRVLAFDPLGAFATGFNGDAPSFEESAPTVTAPGQTVTVNIGLHLAGHVKGTVSTSGSLPPHLTVAAYNLSGTRRGTTQPDSTGNYSIVLPPGTYNMVAYDDDGAFAPTFFNERQTFAAATPITVTAQATIGNISFSLQLGARFAGIVTDTTDAPIANAVVLAYNAAGVQITFAIAGSDGMFSLTVPAGTYRLVAFDPAFVFATGFLNGANSFDSSPPIALSGGQARTDLVFRLQRGGNVTGTVIDSTTVAGIRGISVAAYNPDGTQRTFVTTDANGKYVLLLPPGNFRIVAFDPTLVYAAQFYSQSTNFAHATAVTPSAGQTVTLQPFTLSAGGHVAGTVTDATTGIPVAGATVSAYDDSGNLVTNATTASDGTYRLVVLPGRYRLIAFDPQLRYAPAYAGGVVTFNAIAPLSVTTDVDTHMSFALQRGTQVSGTVVDHLHAPVADVIITALDLNENPIETAISASDGSFRLSLVPGPYKFAASDPNRRFPTVYFGGPTFATATIVTVDAATGAPRLTVIVPTATKRRSVGAR